MRTPVHLVDERPLIGRATIGSSATVAVGDEDAIQTPGNEGSVGLRLRREQVEFVYEVPGQLVDIGDQFSARDESEMQPTQVA